ncbi:hypothetical protein GYMLUDRAFT_86159 [Collybiopsis luxurians FD-317 M1]|uniref:Unplaced genomic scaffold GYMLUscaffold_35, whole genome shotgun sequence n=1 Tax=Collybiopsis luxurians FD-317 M1 TaxID=944289 RepID=A0A0D0BTL9_9AGAR|nr:hypothetical protein GYMLUDRAFT_86159 [Collybiopsis luxurians FD-317 M1]
MVSAYKRKTASLPERVYLIDGFGNYYSMWQGKCSFTKSEPDYTCEVIVEYYSSDPEQFYLRSWEGTYFEYVGDSATATTVCPFNYKSINNNSVLFTALDIDTNRNTFAFRVPSGKFLSLQAVNTDSSGQSYLPLADYNSATITVAEPVIRRVLTDFEYDTSGSTVTQLQPEVALSTTVRNDSHSDSFVQELSYSYQKSHVGTWSNMEGVELSVKYGVEYGIEIPFVAEATLEVGVAFKYEHTETGSNITTTTVSSTSALSVPAAKTGVATILVKKARIDVPFTYSELVWYQSGRMEENVKNGIYNNVESYMVDVQINDGWKDIPQ